MDIIFYVQISSRGLFVITMLQQDISRLIANFSFNNQTEVVEGYQENSSWLNFVRV